MRCDPIRSDDAQFVSCLYAFCAALDTHKRTAHTTAKAMKLTVKTLKGVKFTVEVDGSTTVGDAKGIIVSLMDCRWGCFVLGSRRRSYLTVLKRYC